MLLQLLLLLQRVLHYANHNHDQGYCQQQSQGYSNHHYCCITPTVIMCSFEVAHWERVAHHLAGEMKYWQTVACIYARREYPFNPLPEQWSLVTCCYCRCLVYYCHAASCTYGFACCNCAFEEQKAAHLQADTAAPADRSGELNRTKEKSKRHRNPKPNQKKTQSDNQTLKQREDMAKQALQSMGVAYDTLDVSTALRMHQQQHCTLHQRLALRVTIAEKMINGGTVEQQKEQFDTFAKKIETLIQDLDKSLQDVLRSAFLKAAHHRMEPWKHLAKHMQKTSEVNAANA